MVSTKQSIQEHIEALPSFRLVGACIEEINLLSPVEQMILTASINRVEEMLSIAGKTLQQREDTK